MESKSLLIGIISFIAGALLVSTAATTFDKPTTPDSMDTMVQSLHGKSGDEFDKKFIAQMIIHHEGAIEMAKLAEDRAKHDEIKRLSKEIMTAQSQEIDLMQTWQDAWDYKDTPKSHPSH